jgi:uncharacterized protein (DUF2236 family)
LDHGEDGQVDGRGNHGHEDVTTGSFDRHREAVRARLSRSGHTRPGPDSVSWKVNREIVVIAGWGRAVLLQIAHPAIAAGVNDHSSVRAGLLAGVRRLRSTVGAMLAITFGDEEQLIAAAAGIHAIHDRINGQVGVGRTYSAHDPALQQWVHATLLESIPLVYEQLIAPLTPDERDRYCAEAAFMEAVMGIPAGRLPRNIAQLDAYNREMFESGAIAVTGTSRALARAVLFPPMWRVLWPVMRPIQLLTIGSLPPSIRSAYGFEWTAREERALARWTAVLRTVLRILPPFARQWPMARRDRALGAPNRRKRYTWRRVEPKPYSR